MGMAKENQFHVLAVDDSIIDRMLIERLLKTSSFHGKFTFLSLHFEILKV
jgi:response regulator RpfG family c-di-GMP phosphodiesterase